MAGDTLWPYVVVSFDPSGTSGAVISQLDNLGTVFGVQGGSPIYSNSWSITGGISAYFDGAARVQTVTAMPALNFGTSNFEMSLWVYQTSRSWSSPACLLEFGQDVGGQGWRLFIGTDGGVCLGGHAGAYIATAASVVPLNTATHIAVSRVGGTATIWINGVSRASGSLAAWTAYGGALQISGSIGPYWLYTGFIDRVEILNGAARHTAAFTPETSAFLTYAGQVMGTVKDEAGALCARTVRAYRRSNGALAGSTVSNATTGAFTINTPTADAHTVLALDDLTIFTPADPSWASVVLAMHMNGANNSTTCTDVKGNVVTAVGNANISTDQSKFGGASAKFDGTGDYLSTPNNPAFDFGTGDLTMEAWVYIAANSTPDFDGMRGATICNTLDAVSGVIISGWNFSLQGNTTTTGTGIAFDSWNAGAGTLYRAAIAVSQGAWHHIAATITGGVRRLFLDGVLLTGATLTIGAGYVSVNSLSSGLRVGMTANTSYPTPLNGYVDDLRITKGVARYTANFTPPTVAFLEAGSTAAEYNALVFDNVIPV